MQPNRVYPENTLALTIFNSSNQAEEKHPSCQDLITTLTHLHHQHIKKNKQYILLTTFIFLCSLTGSIIGILNDTRVTRKTLREQNPPCSDQLNRPAYELPEPCQTIVSNHQINLIFILFLGVILPLVLSGCSIGYFMDRELTFENLDPQTKRHILFFIPTSKPTQTISELIHLLKETLKPTPPRESKQSTP